MRAIDGDNLFGLVKGSPFYDNRDRDKTLDMIDATPTLYLDGWPRRGFWKPARNGAGVNCSRCGRRIRRQTHFSRDDFCPKCGAQMYEGVGVPCDGSS